jgi:Leucine-rich repeat (LRR) protein
MATLRELKFAENGLEGDVPSSIGFLRQLEVLELQSNKLTSLPVEICELVRLRSLNVSDNRLASLPADFFTLLPIVELIASKNAFRGTFFAVDSVPHLQSLQLSNNSLTSLCEGTILLPALKSLDVSVNRLSALPDISSWSSLTTLLVGENKLTILPEGFVSLMQLRNADFTGNDLKVVDEKIAFMENLDNLTLAANPLRERKFLTMSTQDIKNDLQSRIGPEDGDAHTANGESGEASMSENKSDWVLKPSGTLELSSKDLTEVDEAAVVTFAGSNDVRQIYLQQNKLTRVPAVLAQLTHLAVLDLSKNNIAEPFAEDVHFPKLKELRLPGNKLKSFDGIRQHLSAPFLQYLNVSNNRIIGPLPILRSSFPELRTLLASDNVISEMRAEAIEGLKVVNLGNNEIARLEPEIGLYSGTLTSLEIEGNTFRVPNYALLRKGTETVLAWLRDRIPSPTEEFFVAPRSPETL